MEEVLLNIFIAYSREDRELRNRLDKHLSGLKRRNYINTWYDGQIEPGKEWEKEIEQALTHADIILLLISADFIASDYCFDIEMKKSISRHEKGDAVIIPIILHPCDWSDLPFSKIQGLPQNGKAITSDYWKNPEFAFSEVAKSIKVIVEKLRVSKKKKLLAINEVLSEKENELKITFEQVEELKFEEELIRENIENLNAELKELNKRIDLSKTKLAQNENKLLERQLKEEQKLEKLKKEVIIAKRALNKYNKIKNDLPILVKKLSSIAKEVNRKEIEYENLVEKINRKRK